MDKTELFDIVNDSDNQNILKSIYLSHVHRSNKIHITSYSDQLIIDDLEESSLIDIDDDAMIKSDELLSLLQDKFNE